MSRWRRLRRFLKHDLWHMPAGGSEERVSFPLRLLRILVLAARGFAADSLQLRASALVYYSLLSVVPVAALVFGVAKGFGLEAALEADLREQLAGQQEVLDHVLRFADRMLAGTRGGVVAGAGVALLVWSVIRLLGNIEKSFNAIWGVESGRSPVRKLTDYLAITIIAPILLLISSSAAVFISGRANAALAAVGIFEPVGALVRAGLELIPYVFIWLLLTLLYVTMPNTAVSWRAGLAAGVTAGTLYQLLQLGFILVMVNVTRYNAVYGSFTALPLFLIWLSISWLIVLVGAEISFAVDNAGDYARERDAATVDHHRRRLAAVALAAACSERFLAERPPATAAELASGLGAPARLVHAVLNVLTGAGVLLTAERSGTREPVYLPAHDPSAVTILEVAEAFDRATHPDAAAPPARPSRELVTDAALGETAARWRAMTELMAASDDNLTLAELAAAGGGRDGS